MRVLQQGLVLVVTDGQGHGNVGKHELRVSHVRVTKLVSDGRKGELGHQIVEVGAPVMVRDERVVVPGKGGVADPRARHRIHTIHHEPYLGQVVATQRR